MSSNGTNFDRIAQDMHEMCKDEKKNEQPAVVVIPSNGADTVKIDVAKK